MTNSTAKPASSVILERDGRFLLIERGNPPARGAFAFPGGKANGGESPSDAALRELVEETGIVAHDPVLFAEYDLIQRDAKGAVTSHYFLSVFRAEWDGKQIAQARDDALSVGWFTLDDILTLPIPDSVRDCVFRLGEAANRTEALEK